MYLQTNICKSEVALHRKSATHSLAGDGSVTDKTVDPGRHLSRFRLRGSAKPCQERMQPLSAKIASTASVQADLFLCHGVAARPLV